MISESTLNEIRLRTDIVELIGEYVTLKRAGQSYSGLCPLHSEKTPSFHVHPSKQIFHCFGCHKGGDIFSFYSAVEGTSFPETVRRLAERAGITIESNPDSKKEATLDRIHDRLYSALDWSAKFYAYLLREKPEYKFVHEYLSRRGLTEKTIEKFQIGISPNGWHTLRDQLIKRKFKVDELVQSGLVIQKDSHTSYDRFRNRLMFPIRNRKGRVIGFGARILEDDPKQPKYLNSPESGIFSKRQEFYGLFENQREIRIRKEAVLVEGYMDVVGLYEKGVQNAIATMGTALTSEHCYEIKRYTNRIVTVFDPDEAGNQAWRRSVHLLMDAGIFAKDLTLPDGMDPDDFIKKNSAEAFYHLCEKAPRQITKLLKEVATRGPLTEEQRTEILTELTPVLQATRNLPDRALLWESISLVLQVRVDILKEFSAAPRPPKRTTTGTESITPPPKKSQARPTPPTAQKKLEFDPLDIQFFESVLKSPRHLKTLEPNHWEDGIRSPAIKEMLLEMGQLKTLEDWEKFLQKHSLQTQDPRISSLLTAAAFEAKERFEKNIDSKDLSMFEALKERLFQRRKELEIKSISAQIQLSQQLGNESEQIRLLQRLKALRNEA